MDHTVNVPHNKEIATPWRNDSVKGHKKRILTDWKINWPLSKSAMKITENRDEKRLYCYT
jgi:hypothetical protein